MSDPLMQQGINRRITKDDLAKALSRRVTIQDRFHVCGQQVFNMWDPIDKRDGNLRGLILGFTTTFSLETKSIIDLLLQQIINFF